MPTSSWELSSLLLLWLGEPDRAASSERVADSIPNPFGSAFYFGFHRAGIPFSTLWLKYGNYGLDASVLAERTAHAQSIYFFK